MQIFGGMHKTASGMPGRPPDCENADIFSHQVRSNMCFSPHGIKPWRFVLVLIIYTEKWENLLFYIYGISCASPKKYLFPPTQVAIGSFSCTLTKPFSDIIIIRLKWTCLVGAKGLAVVGSTPAHIHKNVMLIWPSEEKAQPRQQSVAVTVLILLSTVFPNLGLCMCFFWGGALLL